MTWDRWELGQKAIFYDTCIRSGSNTAIPVPPHVETLRRSMLDFSCTVLNQKDGPNGLQLDQAPTRPGEPAADPALTAAHTSLNKAKSIRHGGYAEKRWENFFQSHFFEPLSNSTSVSKGDSRRVSRCNYYYDSFRAESNELWDLFRAHPGDTSGVYDSERAKCPKPDQAFYLPMYHLSDEPKIPIVSEPQARQWNQTSEPLLAEAFSWSDLKRLSSSGLRPTPFRVFEKPPVEASLKCFPWLLVEHKKEGLPEETVCCQAANGGACAITLDQISARYAIELPENAHIPPIPIVTTIGSHVRVWVMYFAKDFEAPCARRYARELTWKKRNRGYVMRAIWEGDVTNLEDVIKFQVILENTHTWAMRVFKPLMSSYVEQWKHVHWNARIDEANSALSRRQQTIERWQTVMPMVQDVLDYHSNMDLEDDKQTKITPILLGSLVHQILSSERQNLTEEMDRLIAERLKPLSLTLEKTITERTTIETQRSVRRASSGSAQSTLPSLGLAHASEDPNDDDYEEHTEAFQTDGSVGEEDAESELRRSTRSNPRMPSAAKSHRTSTHDPPSAEKELGAPDAQVCETTTPSGSTTQEDSMPRAPEPDEHKSPDSAVSPGSDSSIHRGRRSFLVSDAGASAGKPSSRLFSMSPSGSAPVGREPALLPSLSPQYTPINLIDWRSDIGHVDFKYKSTRVSSQTAKLSSSGPSSVSQAGAKGGESIAKKPLIDLTKDSQDS